MCDVIFEAKNITKSYIRADDRKIIACNNISFKLRYGKTLGIVGESGCGKSTLLRILSKLEKADSGQILFKDKDITNLKGEKLRLHRKNIQMIFQDSLYSFSPKIKAWKAITEPVKNYGRFSKTELMEKAKQLFDIVDLPLELLNSYPHEMSGGQRQRLSIARALSLDPEILLCDEATSALDVQVQAQIIRLLTDIQKKRNLSIIFVCHDLALVQSVSHDMMIMYCGNIAEYLPSRSLDTKAVHPYTKALLNCVFSINDKKQIIPVETSITDAIDNTKCCPFHIRCDFCKDECKLHYPEAKEIEKGHTVFCNIYH